MRTFLSNLVATFTGPRYFPEFQWSDKLWTHNVFRFFGLIFGEKYGPRPSVYSEKYEDTTTLVGISLEGKLAIVETMIRSLIGKYSFKVSLVPQMQLAGINAQFGYQPFRFAITFDATSGQSNNNSPVTHVCTGSNLLLWVMTLGDIGSDNLTGITYNSVAMTFVQKIQFPADRWTYNYIQINPSTGSHSIATSGLTFNAIAGISYTGCAQSGQPTANTTHLQLSATTNSLTISVPNANSWIVGYIYGYSNNASVNVGTLRVGGSGTTSTDTNGVVSTGSNTITYTSNIGANDSVAAILSIKPPSAAINSGFFFAAAAQ